MAVLPFAVRQILPNIIIQIKTVSIRALLYPSSAQGYILNNNHSVHDKKSDEG